MTIPDMRKNWGHRIRFNFSEIEVENYSFKFARFVCVSIASPTVHHYKPLQQKTVPIRFSFKIYQNLPDTFLLELRKKKMGITDVIVFAVRTKLSPQGLGIDTICFLF